jgi:hypothetical protein
MKKMTILFLTLWAAVASASTNEIKALPDAIIQKVVADPNDGLSADQFISAKLAFVLGFDVPEFGKKGERVWQVHFTELGGRTDRIAWVNAETGKVMFLMEESRKKTPNQASDENE